MHILALDPATRCGWARQAPGMNAPVSGVEVFDGRCLGTRAHDFRQWLIRKVQTVKIDLVAIEQPFWRPGKSTNADTELWQNGQFWCVHEVAKAMRIKCDVVPIQSWRKHFIGQAQAPKGTKNTRKWLKAAAIERCRLLGWEVKSDDQADALGILDYVRARHSRSYAIHSTPLFRSIA